MNVDVVYYYHAAFRKCLV